MRLVRSFLAVNISLAFILLLPLFTPSSTKMSSSGTNERTKHDETVILGNAAFTRNLYESLSEIYDGNIFFSPISIHAILSLTAQGSAGTTRAALCKALHVPDIETAAEGYKVVMSRLNSIKDVTLLIANKIFLNKYYELRESFRNVVTSHFLAEVEQVDFEQQQAAANTINGWVEKKTNSKIKELISAADLDAHTRLVLVNAIYFKGSWAQKFDEANTTTEKFHMATGGTVDVQMMHITKKFYFKYDNDLDAKVLELQYTNENLSMIIILPTDRDGMLELEDRLADMDISQIVEGLRHVQVIVALPKFKIEHTIELNEPLSELGLEAMFDNKADFSSMLKSPEALSVSKVIQKTFIEVNEEGAEAAAATAAVTMIACCAIVPIRQPETFIADHPFLVLLQHMDGTTSKNPIVMFKGRISVPN